jgi:hypothetical protein
MDYNSNTIKPDSDIKESQTVNTTDLLIEDGNYFTIDQIKDLLPYGDEIIYKILYLQLNDKILTEEEKNNIKLELERMKKSNSIRIKPDLKQFETIEIEE